MEQTRDYGKMLSKNIAFLALLYFLQGLPYGLQSRFLPIYFRSHGMSLANVGLFKLLLIPWMCKALWAPLVDRYATKKTWLAYSMGGLLVACMCGSYTPPELIGPLAAVLFLFNLLTATQDIAVDGIAIQILATSELADGNIAQVVGYKLGAVVSGGVLTWLSDYISWSALFMCLAIVYAIALFSVVQLVPDSSGYGSETEIGMQDTGRHGVNGNHRSGDGWIRRHWVVAHFRTILHTEETRWVMLFVFIYKLGEQGALSMLPLFLVDRAMPASSIGFWTGVIGQGVSIAGSVLGGRLISHYRISPHQVVATFCQLRLIPLALLLLSVTTWTYVDQSLHTLRYALAVCSMNLLLLSSGIVTTATFTLMMYCSQMAPPSVQASHYTTIATVEVLGKLTFSVLIGSLTDIVGYPCVFTLFIVLTMLVLPVLVRCPAAFKEINMRSENKDS